MHSFEFLAVRAFSFFIFTLFLVEESVASLLSQPPSGGVASTRNNVSVMCAPTGPTQIEREFERDDGLSKIRYHAPLNSLTMTYPDGSREKVLSFNFANAPGVYVTPVDRNIEPTSMADKAILHNFDRVVQVSHGERREHTEFLTAGQILRGHRKGYLNPVITFSPEIAFGKNLTDRFAEYRWVSENRGKSIRLNISCSLGAQW